MERGGIIFINLARCYSKQTIFKKNVYPDCIQKRKTKSLRTCSFFCEHILFQDKKKHTCLFLKKVEKEVLFATIKPTVVHIH